MTLTIRWGGDSRTQPSIVGCEIIVGRPERLELPESARLTGNEKTATQARGVEKRRHI